MNSILDAADRESSALRRAYSVQRVAGSVGFDFGDALSAWQKVREEAGELLAEMKDGGRERQSAELGDLLFAIVNVARLLDIDPVKALNDTNDKFGRRFRHIEAAARARQVPLEQLSLAEMDALWDEAKRQEHDR